MQFPVSPFLLLCSLFSHVLTTPLGGDQKRPLGLDTSNDITTRNRTIQLEGFVGLFFYLLSPPLRFRSVNVYRVFSHLYRNLRGRPCHIPKHISKDRTTDP